MESQKSKIKIQKYNLKFKTFNFLLAILTFTFCILPSVIFAVDSTPSADIKTKLEELKKEVASRAAKLKQEVTKKLTNKAYVGSLKSISPTSLTLASEVGPKLVTINLDTLFESKIKSRSKFSQKNLIEEDYIAALGDVDETGVLIAKKIVLLPTINHEPKTYLWGQVISGTEKLFTLKDAEDKNIAATIPTTFGIGINDVIIATGKVNKNGIFEAKFVHIVQSAVQKPKKTASPSASLKASPTSKPKVSPKATPR